MTRSSGHDHWSALCNRVPVAALIAAAIAHKPNSILNDLVAASYPGICVKWYVRQLQRIAAITACLVLGNML